MAGIEIVTDNSDRVKADVQRTVETALEAIGLHLDGEAKLELEAAPRRVDTGLLRNSITHAVSGQPAAIKTYHADTQSDKGTRFGFYTGNAPDDPDNQKAVYIGSNVEYAAYVHEGTTRMTANRYLKNAIEHNHEQIKQILLNTFADAFR